MHTRFLLAALPLALIAAPVHAQAPAGTFGSLPSGSFGGSGIPTDAVMLGGVDGVTIGLSATQRYTSPALTNDGAGTFFATTGISTGAPVNAGFARWNFDYFVGGAGPDDFFAVFVDLDPAAGTPLGSLFPWGPGWAGDNFDSSNLGYAGSLYFDPEVAGEYTIALYQYADAQHADVLDHVAISVQVSATPEPATVALMSMGILGVALVRRRRARA